MVAKITPEVRKCAVCPNTFLVGGGGNKKRSQRTCSHECNDKARPHRGRPCLPLTATQSAYLAGILDADGHVGLYASHGYAYRVTLNISNTDVPLLNWIKEVTGVGSVNRQRTATATTKACYQWNCVSNAAATFLEQILPYMRVKRERAELARTYHRFLGTPEGKLDRQGQLRFREQMLALNKRGPVSTGT